MSVKDSVRIEELETKIEHLHESFHRLEEAVVMLMHEPVKEPRTRVQKKKKTR
jgi:hypothetical protein